MHNQIHSSHLKTFKSRQLDFFIHCHKRPQDVCKFLFKVKKRQKGKTEFIFLDSHGYIQFFNPFTVVDFDGTFCYFEKRVVLALKSDGI